MKCLVANTALASSAAPIKPLDSGVSPPGRVVVVVMVILLLVTGAAKSANVFPGAPAERASRIDLLSESCRLSSAVRWWRLHRAGCSAAASPRAAQRELTYERSSRSKHAHPNSLHQRRITKQPTCHDNHLISLRAGRRVSAIEYGSVNRLRKAGQSSSDPGLCPGLARGEIGWLHAIASRAAIAP